MEELDRIKRAFRDRELRVQNEYFTYEYPAHLVRIQERHQETLRLLSSFGYRPLLDRRILDVGCGDGNMLRQFIQWGATPEHLAGIDLRSSPIDFARSLNPTVDYRCGSATELSWRDESFDLACAQTVFSSVLDSEIRHKIASEMARVLRPGGAILFYDLMFSSPRNPDRRRVRISEVRDLFPGRELHIRRISLAPPIARRIPQSILHLLYPMLSAVPFLRTHFLALVTES